MPDSRQDMLLLPHHHQYVTHTQAYGGSTSIAGSFDSKALMNGRSKVPTIPVGFEPNQAQPPCSTNFIPNPCFPGAPPVYQNIPSTPAFPTAPPQTAFHPMQAGAQPTTGVPGLDHNATAQQRLSNGPLTPSILNHHNQSSPSGGGGASATDLSVMGSFATCAMSNLSNWGSTNASPATALACAVAANATQPKRQRSERKAVPDKQKDGKYFERRQRNNAAAKKSRDQRKVREDDIALRAGFLERENSLLRAQLSTLREEASSLRQLILQKQRLGAQAAVVQHSMSISPMQLTPATQKYV